MPQKIKGLYPEATLVLINEEAIVTQKTKNSPKMQFMFSKRMTGNKEVVQIDGYIRK